jgi:hypothetical protein
MDSRQTLLPRTGRTSAAGLLLVLLGASFLTATMLAASIAPGYDFNAAAPMPAST